MTDIVERLREGGFARPDEAADEIETLRQRVRELEAIVVGCNKQRDKVEAKLTAERAISDKLEKALRVISRIEHKLVGGDWDEISEAQSTANNILAELAAMRKGETE